MAKARLKLSDEIRQAVREYQWAEERSNTDVRKDICVSDAQLSRFLSGKSGLSMEVLDRLAALIDLHVVAGDRSMPGRAARPKRRRT